MKGFGKPRYWLQIVYHDDRSDQWQPLTTNRAKARRRAALALQDAAVDYVLILDGTVSRGGIARFDQILDEFQTYEVPGAKRYYLEVS